MKLIEVLYGKDNELTISLTKKGKLDLDKNSNDGEFNWLLDSLGDSDIILGNEINSGTDHYLIDAGNNVYEFTSKDMDIFLDSYKKESPDLELAYLGDVRDVIDNKNEDHIEFLKWLNNED